MDPIQQNPQRPTVEDPRSPGVPTNKATIENARDTNIFVTSNAARPAAPPTFELPRERSASAGAGSETQSQVGGEHGSVETTTTSTSTAPAGPQVNWGNVAKGALIVTGVVVAAVVGAWLLTSVVLPLITGTGVGASLLSGSISGAVTSTQIAGDVGLIAWNGIIDFMTGFGGSFAGATPAILQAPVQFVSSVATNIAGALGAAGGLAVTVPLAMKQMAALDFMHHDVAQATTTQTHHGADMASTVAAKQSTLAQHSGHHMHGAHADMVTPDPLDAIDEHAAQTSQKAIKVVHHAAEDQHHYQKERANAARSGNSLQATLERGERPAQTWKDRALAAQASNKPIASRKEQSFAQTALDEKHAAALAETSKA